MLSCWFLRERKKKKDPGKTFKLPPNCLKKFREMACFRKGDVIINNYSSIWTSVIDREEASKAHLFKVLSLCVPLLKMAQEHLFTKHLIFHLSVIYLPAFWGPKAPLLFLCPILLSSRMAYRPQLPGLSSGSLFLWHFCVYICNKFSYFLSLVYLKLMWLLNQPDYISIPPKIYTSQFSLYLSLK